MLHAGCCAPRMGRNTPCMGPPVHNTRAWQHACLPEALDPPWCMRAGARRTAAGRRVCRARQHHRRRAPRERARALHEHQHAAGVWAAGERVRLQVRAPSMLHTLTQSLAHRSFAARRGPQPHTHPTCTHTYTHTHVHTSAALLSLLSGRRRWASRARSTYP